MSRAWVNQQVERSNCAPKENTEYVGSNCGIGAEKNVGKSRNRLFCSQPTTKQKIGSSFGNKLVPGKKRNDEQFKLKLIFYVFNKSNFDLTASSLKSNILKFLEENPKSSESVKKIFFFSDLKEYLDQIKFLNLQNSNSNTPKNANIDQIEDCLTFLYLDYNFEYFFMDFHSGLGKLKLIIKSFMKQAKTILVNFFIWLKKERVRISQPKQNQKKFLEESAKKSQN